MKPTDHQRFSSRRGRSAVTVLELLVAVSLISFIVLALYQMFDRTQVQMRRAVREVDKFESGRAVVDILRRDLVQLGYVKTTFDAGQGAIVTNWSSPIYPPSTYALGAYYPAGSSVRLGSDAIFAMANTTNTPPAYPWTYAAPNFRISSFWDTVNPINFQSGTNYLQVCARDDLFFMYFDPQIRVTAASSTSIQPGVSYVATNALTYNGVGRQIGEPFFGLAGVPNYAGGPGVRAVQVDGGWRAVGYRFASTTNAALPATAGIGTLYRFELATLGNDARKMWVAFTNFAPGSYLAQTNIFKRVVDNVVHFKCRAVVNGTPVQVAPLAPGYPSCLLFGTSLPSQVEVELATIDSKIAVQAEAVGTTNYLSQQGDHVQMFRLQVPIRIGVQ